VTVTRDSNGPQIVIDAALDPSTAIGLDLAGWERLLSCARRNAVLAYIAKRTVAAGLIDAVPDAPRAAMLSALASAARLAQLALWELERVHRVMRTVGIPMIALKGVAYLLRGMPHAGSRIISDIDVMVEHRRIDEAENALLAAGWRGTKLDPYDQRYYRKWSHEIPPLRFPGRVLSVDVHHTICPPVSRLRPKPEAFWKNSIESAHHGVGLLSPADSFLHGAVHLFFDSDFDGRFRDLLDLHEMLTLFASEDEFWTLLVEAARAQGLGRPLYYALDTLPRILRTPVPVEVLREVRQFRPPPQVDLWMARTLHAMLMPADPEVWPLAHGGRRWLMYARSHWLRMPPYLLLPHLLRKAWRSVRAASPE